MARNLQYKGYTFRLNEKTRDGLRNLKENSDSSYNLLIAGMIKQFKLKKYVEEKKLIESRRKAALSSLPQEKDAS